ncbi:MAG: NAD-dependent epimerase/dehydratase family protein [Anaerolineae bacterium]|nr:NAD-dependent epimerase/dehydratase family protein [Thermoflexus sp.]MDW8065294.1 NAD-dependent epimerase/dehydratase family protein [Anaerolineae bacterium]
MRLLVTGATGFLGRNLCPYLIDRGYCVRALVRPSSDWRFLAERGAEIMFGDVRDLASVQMAVAGCEMVIHAAAYFRFWGPRDHYWQVNVEGTRNVIHAAERAGIQRFVHISTVAVIGRPRSDATIDETYSCQPVDDYQRTKLEGERIVQQAVHRGLPAVILRPGAFYGPWGRYAFNRLFFEDFLKGLRLQVHGGQRYTFPIFVPDLCRVIEAALSLGRVGEIYNVADRSRRHAEIYEIVARIAGTSAWRINVPALPMLVLAWAWTRLADLTGREPYYPLALASYVFYDWKISSEKAERELGFRPTPFEEGARQTLEWYWAQGILPRPRKL